jgi:hypothetical protein
MPFIHRRVFYAKAGMAEQIVNHFQAVEKMMEQYGFKMESRILTDYMSGRSGGRVDVR